MSLKKFVVGIMLLSLTAACSKVPEQPAVQEQPPQVADIAPQLFVDPDNKCEYWVMYEKSITPRLIKGGNQKGCQNESTF